MTMWIPVIVVAWNLGGNGVWVNFPMVNFPFSSQAKCEQYTAHARMKIQQDTQYLDGYSLCVKIPKRTVGEPT